MLTWMLKATREYLRAGLFSLVTGRPGPSGFGSATTAKEVTEGIDASGLTVIITGGANGIGLETSRILALRGAHVIIGARNMEAANKARDGILEQCKTAKVDVLKLDLCSLDSVRSFVDSFIALDLPLNILINNAGVFSCPFQLSKDGIELQFATNHIGHFLLTNLLLDKMKHTAKTTGIEGRIVIISSICHIDPYKEGIRFDKINDPLGYTKMKAYGQSKLANILHANELSRRLQEEGANITVNSIHPGSVMTDIMKYNKTKMRILEITTRMIWKTIPQGAATHCYVALHPNLKGVTGKYYVDCNECKTSAMARDAELGKKLWDFSNKMIENQLSWA
ncbi:hypothetical protein SAY86_030382 [Trapa natans]|uniref:Short-chain dehydrogenase TIC 32, chloroplastic n=1 Tax=Trapa natans TaxID=22666 RepID=A0AAN7M2S8_TRANT|nr:hypothetical protein SAY86_030382 [Trapa natans]